MTFITTSLKKFDAEFFFADTDSLTCEIKPEDVYGEFIRHKHLFDFSSLSKDWKFYDSQNKMVIGRMKNEYKGIPINRLIG